MASRPYTVGAVQSRKDGRWRVQVKAGNGQIVATGHQAYFNKFSADRAARGLVGAELLYKEPRGIKKG